MVASQLEWVAKKDGWVAEKEEQVVGYNEFDFYLENEEPRPFDVCKIEI